MNVLNQDFMHRFEVNGQYPGYQEVAGVVVPPVKQEGIQRPYIPLNEQFKAPPMNVSFDMGDQGTVVKAFTVGALSVMAAFMIAYLLWGDKK
jgi:hypothetical protein